MTSGGMSARPTAGPHVGSLNLQNLTCLHKLAAISFKMLKPLGLTLEPGCVIGSQSARVNMICRQSGLDDAGRESTTSVSCDDVR